MARYQIALVYSISFCHYRADYIVKCTNLYKISEIHSKIIHNSNDTVVLVT